MTLPIISVPSGLTTRLFAMAPGAVQHLPEMLATAFPGLKPWLIADENTWAAAGKAGAEALASAGVETFEPYIFPGTPKLHPDYAYSEMLAEKMPSGCVPVAVGSGVINDIVKCAAGKAGIGYCCVPTACSVDGYTSAGGSMSVNQRKITVQCPAPQAVLADVNVLRDAPPEMLASGYADLLTKVVAGADWIIADAMGEQAIREDVWQLIQGNIRRWCSDSSDMAAIFEGLAATGYSMQMMLDSRPASGAEHLCSHVWEMEGLQFNGEDVSHGFKVGVGLLFTSALQEYVIANDFETLRPRMQNGLTRQEREAEISRLLIKGCYGASTMDTAMSKFREGEALEAMRAKAEAKWDEMRAALRKQLPTTAELTAMMKQAGCPTTPQEIGLDWEQAIHGIRTAQLIRNRYTILDLLYELGLLDDAIAVCFQNK